MIFGFNTDVKHGDTVYHVQTEARQSAHLLQTTIFVRGQCVGKYTSSYAERVREAEFGEQQMHELLKSQHRSMLDAIREGRLEATLRASQGAE